MARDATTSPGGKPKAKGKRKGRKGPKAGNRRADFVREYLKDRNATQAALRAGYSPRSAHSQGGRLLQNVEIQRQIAEATAKVAERAEVDAAYVLTGLKSLVERCMQVQPVRYKGVEVDGEFTFDSSGAARGYELLGKSLGLFTDRVKVDLADLRQKSDEELEAEAKALGLA